MIRTSGIQAASPNHLIFDRLAFSPEVTGLEGFNQGALGALTIVSIYKRLGRKE